MNHLTYLECLLAASFIKSVYLHFSNFLKEFAVLLLISVLLCIIIII